MKKPIMRDHGEMTLSRHIPEDLLPEDQVDGFVCYSLVVGEKLKGYVDIYMTTAIYQASRTQPTKEQGRGGRPQWGQPRKIG